MNEGGQWAARGSTADTSTRPWANAGGSKRGGFKKYDPQCDGVTVKSKECPTFSHGGTASYDGGR